MADLVHQPDSRRLMVADLGSLEPVARLGAAAELVEAVDTRAVGQEARVPVVTASSEAGPVLEAAVALETLAALAVRVALEPMGS